MKRLLLALLLVLPTQAFAFGAKMPDGLYPRIEVGPVKFRFSKKLLHGDLGGPAKREAVLLLALYPSMEPRSAEGNKAGIVPSSKAIQILISDPQFHKKNDPKRTARRDIQRKISADLLEPEEWDGQSSQIFKNFYRQSELMGLERFVPHPDMGSNSRGFRALERDRYYAKFQGDLIEVAVRCDGEIGNFPNPGCSMYFEYKMMTLKVTFRRPMLSEWNSIRQVVTSYLDEASRPE